MSEIYHPKEIELARKLGVNEACIANLMPNDLYRIMMEKAFLDSCSERREFRKLQKLIKAWQYNGVHRGSPEFEALLNAEEPETMEFLIDGEQTQKFIEWDKEQPRHYVGAIGGDLEFSFTPTSLGVIVTATRGKNKIDLTNYWDW